MEKGKVINFRKYLLIAIFIATVFMSIGYATVNSVTLDVGGKVSVEAFKGLFIYDINIDPNSNANLEGSKIDLFHETMAQSRVVLNDNINSTLTMNVTIYNKSDNDVYFDQVVYGSNFYDNNNIDFTLTGLTNGQKLSVNDNVSFQITFKYSDAYKATNPSTFDNILNSYLNFRFVNGYSITYNGFSSTNGLADLILDGTTKTISFTSTTGIPYSVNVTGCTSNYSSPTLTLSDPTENVVVTRVFSVTYSGFTGSTSGLVSEMESSGGTITFNNTTGIPNNVSVSGATGSYTSPTLTITNVTNDITVTAYFGQQGSGTPEDPYIDPTPTEYDPDDVDPGTSVVFPNVPGEPQVTKDEDGSVVSFEYTDASATNPVIIENGDHVDTGIVGLNGEKFTIHMVFNADLTQNNGKFILAALEETGNTFNGFSLYDYNSGYVRVGVYRNRARSTSTGLLVPNNYATGNSSAVTGMSTFDVTVTYDPKGNQGRYANLVIKMTVNGNTKTSTIKNTAGSTIIPETLNNATITIGGNGINNTDDISYIEIVEFTVTKD